jgi:hypothetical protein
LGVLLVAALFCIATSVSPVVTCSSRFCAVKIVDSNTISYLVVCVYMPGYINSSSHIDYLNTIGELKGFLDVHNYDVLLIVGDFNVDFDRRGPLASLLLEFMADNHLVASDLSYRSAVSFTYVRDDGSCRSWIDHVLALLQSSTLSQCVKTRPLPSYALCMMHLPGQRVPR